jgi:hypothetical protein
MPVHLLLVGPPAAGKSYTLKIVLSLLPPAAYHEIDAGSPRVLIYDHEDLRHRIVIFGEADSLPAGEDNPAASAIRNLLQEHQLKYKVAVKDPEQGRYQVQEIVKYGPTVLITTAVRRLGAQLDSRLFSLEVPDDPTQVRHALATQAAIETNGTKEPDASLIAFQAYLQVRAPWDVCVPYAPRLSQEIGRSPVASRVNRDFSRLLSLIKAVALIRHRHRQMDSEGRIVAEVADYATVYSLVKSMYESTVTGVTEGVREVVKAVNVLVGAGPVSITQTRLASHLKISKMAVNRRVRVALEQGWLINDETRVGRPHRLKIGEPLPDPAGLPHPDSMLASNGVTPPTDDETVPASVPAGEAMHEVEL